jgi:uncharacterized membrane-anchored protein
MIKKILLGCIVAISMQTLINTCLAEEPKKEMTAEEFLDSLHFQQGEILLPKKIATLKLPAGFRYLPPADAERVLVDAWGNPPGYESLGMIFPADRSPLDENSWGVIITYDEDGHVKDDDALSIKYDEILADMKAQTQENNEQRKKDGYPAMTLVGWAEPPSYDSATHKFYWAKELSVEGSKANTLNYNIRVLGRKGVLVLNAIANMNQVSEIRAQMPTVVAATEFTSGNRYADFDSSTDKVAEYGLAALLAGGVAAKLGLFGKLFALLLAFKKLIVVGVLALFSMISRIFKGK